MVWSFLTPVAWSPTSFGNLCVHNKVMSEIELWALIVPHMGDVSGETQSVSVTVFLNSHVPWKELVNQSRMTVAAARGVSQGEDRAIQNVLICSPIQTLMTLCASKEKQTTGCNEKETNTWLWQFFVFFLITVWFDLIWSACVYKSPLFKEKC